MLRRVGKIVFFALAFLGLLTAAAILYATSEPGSRRISAAVHDAIRAQTGFEVAFGKIDLGFLPPRLTIRDVTARDGKGRVSCAIEEAELAPEVLALARGELVIEEVYLGAPRCRVDLDTAAIADLRATTAAPAPAGPAHLDLSAIPRFEVFALSDGYIEAAIDDAASVGTIRAIVSGLSLDVTSDEDAIEVRGLVGRASARWSKGDAAVDERLDRLEFRAGLSEAGVDIRHVAAEVGGVSLEARDAFVPMPLWPSGPRVGDLSVRVELESLGRLPLPLPTLQGEASFDGQVSARKGAAGLEVYARGRAEWLRAKVDEFVVGDVGGVLSLAPQGVAFSETRIATAGGVIRAEGTLAFDGEKAIEADVSYEDVDLGPLLANLTLRGAQVTQRMTGTAVISGHLAPLSLEIQNRISVADHAVWSTAFRDPRREPLLELGAATVVGPLRVTERAITAEGLDVRFGGSHVTVDLGFNLELARGWYLVARSERIDLADLGRIAGLPVAGRGSVSCRITDAHYGDPRIVGSAALDGAALAGVRFDRAEMGVRFADLVLSFDGLTVRGPRTVMSSREIAVDFGAKGGLAVQAKVEVERAAIEDLERAFGLDLARYGAPRGLVYGRVALDYSPRALRIEAQATHEEITVFGERFGAGSAVVSYDGTGLTIDHLDLRKGGGEISLTGAVLADGSIDVMGMARGVALSGIDYGPFRALGIDGVAQVFVAFGGTLQRPVGTADLRIDDLARGGARYGTSHLALAIDGFDLTARGYVGDDLVTLEHGVLDLATRRFEVEAFAYDLDVVKLLGLDTRGQRVAVVLTGEAAIRGRLDDPPGITGRALLEDVRVGVNDFRFASEREVVITAAKDEFRLRRARFRADELVFDVSGRATFDKLRLAVRGLADLGALSDLIEPVTSSSGRLLFDGAVSGAWSDPHFYGRASIEDGAAAIRGLPFPIEGVTGSIGLGAKAIRFEGVSARAAGGRVDVDGQIDLDGLAIRDYRFRGALDRIALQLTEDLALTASTVKEGLLLRRGKRGLPYVTGDVEVSDLRYTRDLRVVQLSDLSIDRLTGAGAGASSARVLEAKNDTFEYDVRLHGKRNLVVRNNMVDAALRIDDVEEPLRLVGSNQMYGFLGRVLGTTGQVRFQGQVFDIRYASLVFRDKLRPDNPYFRVTADGQVRDWRVSITAEGTVDDYKITLASQPYLSNEDLVFLMLTGMTKAERLQYGGSEIAPISDLVSNVGGEVIPVEVRIYNEYSEKAGKDTTRISLGKRFTDDVWVSVSSSVGKEREIEANLEYKINDNFSLFADYDNESQAGNLGVDLRFRLEF